MISSFTFWSSFRTSSRISCRADSQRSSVQLYVAATFPTSLGLKVQTHVCGSSPPLQDVLASAHHVFKDLFLLESDLSPPSPYSAALGLIKSKKILPGEPGASHRRPMFSATPPPKDASGWISVSPVLQGHHPPGLSVLPGRNELGSQVKAVSTWCLPGVQPSRTGFQHP